MCGPSNRSALVAPPARLDRAASALAGAGLLRVLERLDAWRGVLVLNYHRIGDASASPLDHGLFSASVAGFDDQVRHLARRAEVIPLEQVPTVLDDGRGRKVCLTFDDGYRDNYEHALPSLQRHGVHATFFLATGLLGRPDLAWWDELAWLLRRATVDRVPPLAPVLPELLLGDDDAREATIAVAIERYKRLPASTAEAMLDHIRQTAGAPAYDGPPCWMSWDMARTIRDAGMGIGGHTVHHPVLANVDDARLVHELDGCADRLRDELGVPMRMFAYPVGREDSYDDRAVEHLRRSGVTLACAFSGGFARPGETDLLRLPRASVTANMPLATVRLRVALPQRFARW